MSAGEAATTLAVLPARGGSKRIPGKNIKSMNGRPLISWAIETARASAVFDEIIVSTDDDAIAEVALTSGATVPFRRPAELADDRTGTRPVVGHAVEAFEELTGSAVGAVCCIYPGALFVTPEDIRGARRTLDASDAEVVMTGTTFDFPIQRALRLDEAGNAVFVWPEHALTRSQDLEERYHDAGQFYWAERDHWVNSDAPVGGVRLHLLDRMLVQDIDTPEDWRRAEAILAARDVLSGTTDG